MKKFAMIVVACALAVGATACSKKKADTTPASSGDTMGDTMGGDAYGAANPCEGAANPCDGAGNPCDGESNPCGM